MMCDNMRVSKSSAEKNGKLQSDSSSPVFYLFLGKKKGEAQQRSASPLKVCG